MYLVWILCISVLTVSYVDEKIASSVRSLNHYKTLKHRNTSIKILEKQINWIWSRAVNLLYNIEKEVSFTFISFFVAWRLPPAEISSLILPVTFLPWLDCHDKSSLLAYDLHHLCSLKKHLDEKVETVFLISFCKSHFLKRNLYQNMVVFLPFHFLLHHRQERFKNSQLFLVWK